MNGWERPKIIALGVFALAAIFTQGCAAIEIANTSQAEARITSPLSGTTVSGTVTISCEAKPSVQRVNLFIDSAILPVERPCSTTWDSTSIEDGTHTITLEAYSASNQLLGKFFETINVSNPDAWRMAGFGPDDAVMWGQFSPRFSPKSAAMWHQAGFSVADARDFLNNYPDITPQEARRFQAAGNSPSECSRAKLSKTAVLEWLAHGFSCAAAAPWRAVEATPSEAAMWKARGLTSSNYDISKRDGISTAELNRYRDAGADLDDAEEIRHVKQYLDHGFSLNSSVSFARVGISPDQLPRSIGVCHGTIYSTGELIVTNPFSVIGKCYKVPVIILQWLTAHSALTGPIPIRLDFDKTPNALEGVAKGIGAYQYQSVDGALRTVPYLHLLQ